MCVSVFLLSYVACKSCLLCIVYVGVSKRSQTTSTDRQPMALRECVLYA